MSYFDSPVSDDPKIDDDDEYLYPYDTIWDDTNAYDYPPYDSPIEDTI